MRQWKKEYISISGKHIRDTCSKNMMTIYKYAFMSIIQYQLYKSFHNSMCRNIEDNEGGRSNILRREKKLHTAGISEILHIVFVIIAILSLTALKAILPLLLRCLIYFTGGVFFAACVMNMGILGIVFFLVSWLPHGILYLAALALLLLVEPHRFYNRKNPWLLRLAWGMGVAVLVLLGCV